MDTDARVFESLQQGKPIQDARKILMETAEIFISVPKCRGVNNACRHAEIHSGKGFLFTF